MLKKYWPGIVFAIIALGSLGVWIGYTKYGVFREAQHDDKVHYHAGFQIYQDGELLDFSDPEFMYLGSCGDMGSSGSLRDKVHLHDRIGDIIHIHASGVTWSDMFQSLGLAEELDTIVAQSIDGEVVPLNMESTIQPYQSAVFVIGSGEIVTLDDNRVSEEYIREVEEQTVSCS